MKNFTKKILSFAICMVLMVSIFNFTYFTCFAESDANTTEAPAIVEQEDEVDWTKVILITSAVSIVIATIVAVAQANKKFK